MRKFIFAMLAAFAFGALFASVASAEETLLALWLWNNEPVVGLLSTTIKGGIELKDTGVVGEPAVLCTASADGSVGENGEDETTEILNVHGVAVGELPNGLPLLGEGEGTECKTVKVCLEGTVASPIEVWPLGLPWHTQLFLMVSNNTFLVLIFSLSGEIGYELLCLVFPGVVVEDECKAPNNDFEFEVLNDTENAAIPAGAETTPLANCSRGGAATGRNIADELTFILPLEGLLSVSSE